MDSIHQVTTVSILQLNVGRSIAATQALQQDLGAYDLVCLQEPYTLKSGKVAGFAQRYPTIQADATARTAIIVVRPDLQFLVIKAEKDYVAIQIDTGVSSVLVVSCYLSPNEEISPVLHGMQLLLDDFPSCVICGDFNAKSPLWGNPHEDARGREVLEYMASNSLTIWNSIESEPTFLSSKGSSWIDLTIGRLDSQTHLESWEIEEIETATEHRRIVTRLSTFETRTNQRARLRPRDLIFPKLSGLLLEAVGGLDETWLEGKSAEDCIGLLTSSMHEACDKSRKRQSQRSHKVPWWNLSLTLHRKKVVAMRRRFRYCAEADYRKALERSKIENRQI